MSCNKEEILEYFTSSTAWIDELSLKRKSKSSSWRSNYLWLLENVAYDIQVDWRDLMIESSIIKLVDGKVPGDIDRYKHPMRRNIQGLAYDNVIGCGNSEAKEIKNFYTVNRAKNLTEEDFKSLIDLELNLLRKCIPFLNQNYEELFR